MQYNIVSEKRHGAFIRAGQFSILKKDFDPLGANSFLPE